MKGDFSEIGERNKTVTIRSIEKERLTSFEKLFIVVSFLLERTVLISTATFINAYLYWIQLCRVFHEYRKIPIIIRLYKSFQLRAPKKALKS